MRSIAGKTILASSPDISHYGEFLKSGTSKIMPSWTLPELLESRELIQPELSAKEVKKRFYK